MEPCFEFDSDRNRTQPDWLPVFKRAEIYTFPGIAPSWSDNWILPLQYLDGTFSFLLIDSRTYKTLGPEKHFLLGFSNPKQAVQAANIYLGQCRHRFIATFDFEQEWPCPL